MEAPPKSNGKRDILVTSIRSMDQDVLVDRLRRVRFASKVLV
jgi:hypothetical protein